MHYPCVSGKIVSCVFPPFIFWWRYSCEYKKTFFTLLSDDFSAKFFARTIRVFLEKLFRAFSPPQFFRHDIRMNITKRFSHFFTTIFSPTLFAALFVCLWKNCFARFIPPIFRHDIRVNIKKTFFALFSEDFFPNIFACTNSVFLEKLFRAFCSPYFLITIFVWI